MPWLNKIIWEERYTGIRRKRSCSVEFFCFPSPTSAVSKTRRSSLVEEGQCTAMGGERGPRAYSVGLPVGLKTAKLLLKGRKDPGTL